MPDLTRRQVVAAGAAGAALVTSGGIALAEELGPSGGAPTLPPDPTTAKFDFAGLEPQVDTEWGTAAEATVKNFPILEGSDAAVFHFTLKPGRLREPHWHPNAWEVDVPIEGTAEVGIVNPDGTTQIVTIERGQVAFIPQAWAHFIRNPGKTELKMMLTFGNNQPDDVGLSTMFGGMPTDTFTETFGVQNLNGATKSKTTSFFVP
ncbi:MAG: cupin domain-containing protein [Actinobacteria bacterium]|nr:cupin domain-containing protein [Actinomycetota bacterium]